MCLVTSSAFYHPSICHGGRVKNSQILFDENLCTIQIEIKVPIKRVLRQTSIYLGNNLHEFSKTIQQSKTIGCLWASITNHIALIIYFLR